MSHRYRDLLRLPGARRLVLAGVPARLPIATYGIGLLALVRAGYGSFALAGVVVGAYTAAAVVSGGLLGRLAQRSGFPRLLVALTVADAVVMAILLAAVDTHLGPLAVTGLGIALGLALPPAGVIVRSRWASVTRDEASLARAMFLESALDEAIFVLGPSVVAVVGALSGPTWALAAAAIVTSLGNLGLATLPSPPVVVAASASRSSATTSWRLYAGFVGLGTAFAAIQVGTFAFTRAAGSASAAGLVLAWFSVVSLAAGLALGRARELPAFSFGLGALGAAVVVIPFGATTVAGLAGFAVPAATAASATVALGYAEASRATDASGRAVVYAWCGASLGVGLALGNALCGVVAQHHGATSAYLLGAGAAAAGALLARPRLLARGAAAPGDFAHALGVGAAGTRAGDAGPRGDADARGRVTLRSGAPDRG